VNVTRPFSFSNRKISDGCQLPIQQLIGGFFESDESVECELMTSTLTTSAVVILSEGMVFIDGQSATAVVA
jgi:hypothetical protein